MTQLIINADDFGLTPNINRGIVQLFERGAITSTSALATAACIAQGIAQLPKMFHDRVGVHLCLDEEVPVSSPGQLPSLVDSSTGRLLSRRRLIARVLQQRVSAREIYIELKAQIERLLALGITPDHVDGHGHIHVIPAVARVVAALMDEYDIMAVRRPVESFWPARTVAAHWPRVPVALAIAHYATRAFKGVYASKVTTDAFYGLLASGHAGRSTMAGLAAAIRRSDVSSIELMCHPGLTNDEPQYRHWRYDWTTEWQAALMAQDLLLRQGTCHAASFRALHAPVRVAASDGIMRG